MLVDGEVVVHIELHHRHHVAERRHEPLQHTGFVHAAQGAFRVDVPGQDVEEDAVGFRVGAQAVIDQIERMRQLADRVRMKRRVDLLGVGKEPQNVDRIALEHLRVGDVETIVVDAEIRAMADRAAGGPRQRPDDARQAGCGLQLAHFEARAQDRRQCADVLGGQEVVLHAALDTAHAGLVLVAERGRQLGLDVEGQALLGAAGQHMHEAADGPQEVLAPAKGVDLLGGEQAGLDRARANVVAVDVLDQPMQRMEIAQAALTVLDVGLDPIAGLAGLGVTGGALLHLGGDERPRCAAHDVVGEAGLELGIEARIAVDQAGIEQRRPDRHVGQRQLQALVDGASGVPDLQAEVPQHVKYSFGDALRPCRFLVGQQEQEIDIRARCQQTAAVAASRNDRHPLGIGGIGRPPDVGHLIVDDQLDQFVHEHRQATGTATTVQVGLEIGAIGSAG